MVLQDVEYELTVADVNGDGKVNSLDMKKIYNHNARILPLW